jgi:hypothetical protein
MRLMVLSLLLSAGLVATGQTNRSASPNSGPIPCGSKLQVTSPSPSACPDAISPVVSTPTIDHPNLSWTDRGQQVKPAVPAQLMTRDQNALQLLALNQLASHEAVAHSPHGKSEPIPTTFPIAHFENLPTDWPGLKYLLIDQAPSATSPTKAKTK